LKIKAFSAKLRGVIINWYGGGCYKISASDADIVVDPSSSSGAGGRLKGDLVLKTAIPVPLELGKIEENEISIPGEYEISGVKIRGVAVPSGENSPSGMQKVAYRVVVDGLNLAFLGDIDAELSEKALDILGDIDILFVPSNKNSGKLIKSIDPSIAIPGWGDPKIVMAETGQKPDPQEKLVIKKKDLEAEEGFRLAVLKQ
jgi:hypothetical protein